jgi:hypothetical protein
MISLWNTRRIAISLAQGRLTKEDKFHYLVASTVLFIMNTYVGSLFITSTGGAIFWYEGLLVLVVNVVGLIRCYETYENTSNTPLIEAVVILGVPLSIKILLLSWGLNWLCGWFLFSVVPTLSLSSEAPIELLNFMIEGLYKFYAFLIFVFGAAIFYLRLIKHIKLASGGESVT